MELETLHGFVVRRAAEHGVAVPTTEAVYAILAPRAVRNERVGLRRARGGPRPRATHDRRGG